MNSRRKGKVGEREFAALLREHGFDARRGQQFAGGPQSPDVVSEALRWLHFEIKRTQALNLTDACAQAEGDCGGKPWVVAHRRNHAPWLVTMRAETFFALVRGELPPEAAPDGTNGTEGTKGTQGTEAGGTRCQTHRLEAGATSGTEAGETHYPTNAGEDARATAERNFGGGRVPAAGSNEQQQANDTETRE